MAAFNGATFGAAKNFTEEKVGHGAQSLGYVTNGGTLPTTRKDGTALQEGDYVLPAPSSSFPFTIGTVTFTNKKTTAYYRGTAGFVTSTEALQFTNETPVKDKANESVSGTAEYQSDVNKEFKAKFSDKEDSANKFNSFDDLPSGDLSKYPSGHAVRELNKKNIPSTRKVANYTLENDITVQQIIDAIKDVARTYKNVTFDCDDNTLRNIVANCFKPGEVYSSMPSDMSVEQYKFLTAKGIYDFVVSFTQGTIKIKGDKDTLAEILAIVDMEINDMWFCKENGNYYIYTELQGWRERPGTVDLTNYVKKSEIVNNLTTNDSQKPLSAAQGMVLKGLVDEKQGKLEIIDKKDEMATLNPTITFTNRKVTFMLGNITMNIEGSPASPVVNWTSEKKEILRLPVPPINYSYPSKTRIQISRPSGYWTCEENRHEFYDSDGDHYVNPTIGYNTSWQVKTVIGIGEATTEGETATPIYDVHGNVIHLAEWKTNNQNQLIVEKDGTPFVAKDTITIREGSTTNLKVYTLKYAQGIGYSYVDKYYTNNDGTGEVTGNFIELIEVPITFNTEYMYKCHVMNYQKRIAGGNFVVDNQGRLCTYEITESETSKLIGASLAIGAFSDFEGIDGTIVITPIDHNSSLDETTATIEPHTAPDPTDPTKTIIDYYSMYIHGSNAYTDLTLQNTY